MKLKFLKLQVFLFQVKKIFQGNLLLLEKLVLYFGTVLNKYTTVTQPI